MCVCVCVCCHSFGRYGGSVDSRRCNEVIVVVKLQDPYDKKNPFVF